MSDANPPHVPTEPAGGLPPPPPPPNLIAPAGYTPYATSHFGQAPLKRVGGVARAITILVVLASIGPFVEVALRGAFRDEAEAFLAGDQSTADKQDFITSVLGYLAISMLAGLLVLAAGVLTMIWMYRVISNHRALHRGGTWAPGWGIGGWFLPPIIWVIPTLVLGEMYRASDPAVPVGGEWKSGKRSPLPWLWFALYAVVPLIATAAQGDNVLDQFGSSERVIAEQITESSGGDLVLAVVGLAAAAAFVALVRQIMSRHTRLTGERAG